MGVATESWWGPTSAFAEEPSAETKTMARKAFERGMAQFQKDDYDKAIEQFEVGYRLIPNPIFLYNIAQAHRLSNRAEKALDYYKRYLKDSPEAKNRSEVEAHITNLEAQVASTRLAQIVIPPEAKPDGPEPPPLALEKPINVEEPDEKDRVKTDAGKKNRKLLPIILGAAGGAVVLGVVIGLGVYFGTRPAPASVFEPVTP